MSVKWSTLDQAAPTERYRAVIGPCELLVWPEGIWRVCLAGKPIKTGEVRTGGNRIEDAKFQALSYVVSLHKQMTEDLA